MLPHLVWYVCMCHGAASGLICVHVVMLQHVSNDLYYYYVVELGFYCSLLFTIFSDHKRKVNTQHLGCKCIEKQKVSTFRNAFLSDCIKNTGKNSSEKRVTETPITTTVQRKGNNWKIDYKYLYVNIIIKKYV